MPGVRGESVGTAYVRILADGSGLPDDIADQMRENENAFQAAGSRDSRAYAKAFEKGLEDNPSFIKLGQSLNKSIVQQDLTNDYFSSETWTNFEKTLETRFGEVGQRAGINLRNEFIKSGRGPGGLVNELERMTPRIEKATREIADAEAKIVADFERETRAVFEQAQKTQEDVARQNRVTLAQYERNLISLSGAFTRSYGTIRSEGEKVNRYLDTFIKKTEETDRRSGSAARRLGTKFDEVAEGVGRAFGRGSRNNFLNFFGSVIRNVVSMSGKIITGFARAGDAVVGFSKLFVGFVSDFQKAAANGANSAASLASALGTAGVGGAASTAATGGLNLVIGLGALSVAIGIAAFSAGVLVSGLILLSGVIIALAGTIYASLIAALAALAPLLFPLAGIIAGIAISVGEFKDATGPLAKAMDRVKKAGKGFVSAFKDEAFKNAPRLTNKVAKALEGLDGIAAAAGRGFRRFATIMVNSVTGPEFKQFSNAFEKFLPNAMESLGRILSNSLGGLGGIFTAATPLAERFLGFLEDITEDFSEFTNSKEGQAKITEFLEKAGDSAKSLGGFAKEAFGLVQDLLFAGQDTGDSLFDKMANALRRVRNYLEENPDALKNFFEDAEGFADSLGGTIEDISDAIKKIDTPETRQAITTIIEYLGTLITTVGQLIAVFQTIAGIVGTALGAVINAFSTVIKAALGQIKILGDGIEQLGKNIPGPIGDGLQAAGGKFSDFASSAIDKVEGVQSGVKALGQDLQKTPSMDIDTSGAISKLNFLGQLAERIQAAIRNANAQAAAASGNNTAGTQNSGGSQTTEEGAPNGGRVRGNGRVGSGVSITVLSPQTDPAAVANETMNRLVALGY